MRASASIVLLLPPRMSSDDRLARLAAGGRDDAFSALYERHQPALFAYSRAILRDDDDARDALQSAALKALTALGRTSTPASPRAWLFRIVHNESVSIIRRRRPHETLGDSDGVSLAGPLDDVLARERLQELVTELHALPERQRQALLLRELGGLGYEEIGSAAGMSPAAARQAVHEARRALAEQQEGRDAACDDIRDALADGDGRTRQRRAVRAHLRACDGCRTYDKRLRRRTRDLRSLIPAGAGAFFAHALVIGGSAGGGGAVPAGLAKGVACVLAVGASGAAVVEVANERGVGGRAGSAVADAAAAVRDEPTPRGAATPSVDAPGAFVAAATPDAIVAKATTNVERAEKPTTRRAETVRAGAPAEDEDEWSYGGDDWDHGGDRHHGGGGRHDDWGDGDRRTFDESERQPEFVAPAEPRHRDGRHHRGDAPTTTSQPQPAPQPTATTAPAPTPVPEQPAPETTASADPPPEEPPAETTPTDPPATEDPVGPTPAG